jgi:tRNA(fMet)-specific endonuclease VapC
VRILDSDHCVAVLRGQLSMDGRVPASESLAVTTVSVGELMHGALKSAQMTENLARLGVLLSKVTILPYEVAAARQFGRIKAQLERAGSAIGDLDIQIASIALAYGVPLVTHNQQHCGRIPGLIIEDWL